MVKKYNLPKDEFDIKSVEVTDAPQTETNVKSNQEAEEQTTDTKTEEQKVSQAKKKGGRKSTAHDLKGKVYFAKREKAIHEPLIADLTFSSTDKKLIRELAVRQFLLVYDMTEDYAAKILCFVYDNVTEIEKRKVYLLGNQVIADRLGLSYLTVQKIVQKLHKKNIVIKEPLIKNAYHLSEEAITFFKSIRDNKQVLLTFKEIEEEQLEAVNEDGSLNEEMVN
jgi:hypothetical protein